MMWKNSIFSDGSEIFLSNQNPKLGNQITIKIRISKNAPVQKVFLRYLKYGEEVITEMVEKEVIKNFCYYSCNIIIREKMTQYHFLIEDKESIYFYNQKGIYQHVITEDNDFKIISDFTDVKWARESIFYQIFIDRFFNGNEDNDVKDDEYTYMEYISKKMDWNDRPPHYEEAGNLDFFGGDLEGVRKKISYLKELGITSLYLNPIFKSKSNHKYDCDDYLSVDEHFGGDKALIELSEELHKNNMKLILDISINHTGIDNNWFKEEPEFYFIDEDGSYESWNGVETLPVLNYESEKIKDVIYRNEDSVLKHYLNEPFNIDGWRLDVGQNLGKMRGQGLDVELYKGIREELKELNTDTYILAEHWTDCKNYLQGDMWDASMNYFGMVRPIRKYLGEDDKALRWKIKNLKIKKEDGDIFRTEVTNQYSRLPFQLQGLQFNLLSSHDIHRLHSNIGREDLKCAIMMLFTFVGIPCVYYGDEVLLEGEIDTSCESRFPMEWNEEKCDNEINYLYRKLIKLYKEERLLTYGSFKFLECNEDFISYSRFDLEGAIVFVNSRKENDLEIDLSDIGSFTKSELIFGNHEYEIEDDKLYVKLKEKESLLIKLV